jgi:hypothetical protein
MPFYAFKRGGKTMTMTAANFAAVQAVHGNNIKQIF